MKGNTITAIVDCKKQQNRALKLEARDTITNDVIVLLGQQIDDNTFFEVCFSMAKVLLKYFVFYSIVQGGRVSYKRNCFFTGRFATTYYR